MPEIGHNSELTPEQKSALMMHHIRQIMNINDQIAPLVAERKKIRKLAQSDGFKLSTIDAALRLLQLEDQQIFVDEIKELIEVAQSFNALPPGTQTDLFNDRRPAKERAYDEGKLAGMSGEDPQAPYGPDTQIAQSWLAGWHEGQRIMREELQKAMEKKSMEVEQKDPDFDNTAQTEAAE